MQDLVRYHLHRSPAVAVEVLAKALTRSKANKILNDFGKNHFLFRVLRSGLIGTNCKDDLYHIRFSLGEMVCRKSEIGEVSMIWFQNVYLKGFELSETVGVVDVGAHTGIFTVLAAKKLKPKVIVSVEPDPDNYNFLMWNIKLNRLRNVVPVKCALSDKCGQAKLYLSSIFPGAHSLNRKTDKSIEVSVRTMDSLLEDLDWPQISLVKIDTEGAELEILKGAKNLLTKQENLWLTIAAYHYPGETEQIQMFLRRLGFKTRLDGSEQYVYAFKN